MFQILRTWGEAGIVKSRTKTTPKMEERGTPAMLVGYNANSGSDVYRMWNPKMHRIFNTCDVLWLKLMYFKRTENAPLEEGPTFRENKVRRVEEDKTSNDIKVEDDDDDDDENEAKYDSDDSYDDMPALTDRGDEYNTDSDDDT